MSLIPKVICNTSTIKTKALIELENVCKQCKSCQLAESRTGIAFANGLPDSPIMLIGEAPGTEEDLIGKPIAGKAGQLLNDFFIEAGINIEKDVYICNTVKCKTPQNRVPTNEEKAICKIYLLGQIAIVKPKIILLCGSTAAESFIKDDFKLSDIRGKWLNIFNDIDTMAIFHPSYLLRNHSTDEGSPRWLLKKDLLSIKRKLLEVEKTNESNKCKN